MKRRSINVVCKWGRKYRKDLYWKVLKAQSNGAVLKAAAEGQKLREFRCNHRKGGLHGDTNHGDGAQYSVNKHTFPWGDTWVICLRCAKKWKPNDPEYLWAMCLQTDNLPSGSSRFQGINVVEARRLTEGS